jgi:hypothetical protein
MIFIEHTERVSIVSTGPAHLPAHSATRRRTARQRQVSPASAERTMGIVHREIEVEKVHFSPPTLTKVHFSSINFKIGQTTSLNFSNRAFYLPRVVLKAVLIQ